MTGSTDPERARRSSPVEGAPRNADEATVADFGREWTTYRQDRVPEEELRRRFDAYFAVFPWDELPPGAVGFDAGVGSGRWARFVAPRVGTLHCIDASDAALRVAREHLRDLDNCVFHHATLDEMPLAPGSMDFGYSLGVLHHIPDTESALRSLVAALRPGAPLLVYLYYAFDDRPAWFRGLWRASDLLRRGVSRLPHRLKVGLTTAVAAGAYWPLARLAARRERRGRDIEHWPLAHYRDASFYTMRTDALDRFGTRLEKRYRREDVVALLEAAGLGDVRVHEGEPYWCAVGRRA